ncbi:MAG TPA: recombinase family protein [Acidothermaceae bacterium]|jgi:DNA invertase Pin-like site-specific DNA recombinase
MRLAAYTRVSSESQLDGFGLEVQRDAISRWAKANGHRVVSWHEDAGISGAKDAADRPGLSAALLAVQQPPDADGIVVARLDRLARALTVQEAVLAVVWRAKGRVFTADAGEVLADDPDDPMRTAMRQMVGAFAELDRKMVVKRMRDGRRAKAGTGRKSTGSYAYGYQGAGKGRERDAAVRADEQAAIARIIELRADGKNSYRWIAATLDAEGFRPRRAEHWSSMAVRNIVLRELVATT